MEDLKIYYSLILDLWKAFKKYYSTLTDEQSIWDEMIKEFVRIADKYNNTCAERLSAVLSAELMRELERAYNDK